MNIRRQLYFNIIFWLLYFLYEWLGLAALTGEYDKYFVNACMALPLSLIVSYITMHILVKRYYQAGHKAKFWICQIAITILLLLARRVFNYYIIYPRLFPFALKIPLLSFGKLVVELVNLYLITGLYALFYFVRAWYEQQAVTETLLQEKAKAELELLKSQVQPHFIFNTLNGIYSAALKNNSNTAELIAHLSGFLNYNLYESKSDKVSLSLEIAYIQHYIALQQNRYGDKVDVSVNIYDNIDDFCIEPLLLLPLIENCFTHGVSDSIKNSWVRVDVSRQAHFFSIKIENSVEREPKQVHNTKAGIGLKNVEKRLQIAYPGKHEFKIIEEPQVFLIILKIMY